MIPDSSDKCYDHYLMSLRTTGRWQAFQYTNMLKLPHCNDYVIQASVCLKYLLFYKYKI